MHVIDARGDEFTRRGSKIYSNAVLFRVRRSRGKSCACKGSERHVSVFTFTISLGAPSSAVFLFCYSRCFDGETCEVWFGWDLG